MAHPVHLRDHRSLDWEPPGVIFRIMAAVLQVGFAAFFGMDMGS